MNNQLYLYKVPALIFLNILDQRFGSGFVLLHKVCTCIVTQRISGTQFSLWETSGVLLPPPPCSSISSVTRGGICCTCSPRARCSSPLGSARLGSALLGRSPPEPRCFYRTMQMLRCDLLPLARRTSVWEGRAAFISAHCLPAPHWHCVVATGGSDTNCEGEKQTGIYHLLHNYTRTVTAKGQQPRAPSGGTESLD